VKIDVDALDRRVDRAFRGRAVFLEVVVRLMVFLPLALLSLVMDLDRC
jgi:hypothetical protein